MLGYMKVSTQKISGGTEPIPWESSQVKVEDIAFSRATYLTFRAAMDKFFDVK
jgi:hypothetical protein